MTDLEQIEARLSRIEATLAQLDERSQRHGFLHSWDEIGRALKRQPSTLRVWRRLYGLPVYRRGGRMVAHVSELALWYNQVEQRKLMRVDPPFKRKPPKGWTLSGGRQPRPVRTA